MEKGWKFSGLTSKDGLRHFGVRGIQEGSHKTPGLKVV